jgi:ABC-type phosphate/phosphonate transport system substrate-binding protein
VVGGTTAAAATFDANLIAAAAEGVAEVCGYVEGEPFPYTQPMTQEEIDAIYDECPDGNIVVFAQSAVIPETPFAINGEYPDSFKDAVQAALLDIINDPELVVALRRYYVNPIEQLGLEELDDFYNGLRDTARLLDLDLGG